MVMDEVEEIKRRIDIVDLISSYLTLKKAGANYKAICPFHQEKTPSFMVSGEKQIFKCFGCFLAGTEVVNKEGLKPIEVIKKNDFVLTHKGRLRKVLVKFERHYRGRIIQLRTRQNNESVFLTPDHKVFLIKTKNCTQRDRLTRLCQSRCSQNCPTKYFKSYKIEKVPISEAKIGDYLLYPINHKVEDVHNIKLYDRQHYLKKRSGKSGFPAYDFPETVKVDNRLLKLLGYWIAEGSVYSRGVRFSLGNHEEDFAQEIDEITNKIFGLKASIHRRRGQKSGLEISISNIHLAKIMVDFCGKGASNKKIPDFCLELPVNKQKVLLEAIFRGDGATSKRQKKSQAGRKSIRTVSNVLAFQMKNLLLRMKQPSSSRFVSAYTDKKKINHRDSWDISWMPDQVNYYSHFMIASDTLSYWLLPIKSIQEKNFKGKVYNLMIEDDSSYVVKNFAVGNCGEGGDVFSFVMKMENLEFPEALKMLADRAGVQLKRRTFKPEEGRDQKTKLYQINDFSARVFHKILISHPAGKNALEYLKKRGISSETIKEFMIGYAPSSRSMKEFLLKKGFTSAELLNAGSPDRFFRRIIFPIRNRLGQTIAFTGRVLDPKQEPKYLNTSDTTIFHKGTVLYNLDQARGAIKQKNAVIVVEGQMDVIASHQAGVQNVVASSGTALTAEHLQILYRYTPNINFCFDSDSAGLMTAKKAYEMAIGLGFNVKMVLLGSPAGEYKDPGEMIAANPPAGGPKLWQEVVEKTIPVIDWYFDLAFAKKTDLTSQKKKEIAKEILPIIKIIPDQIEQAHYINLLAKRLDVNEDIVFDALSKVNEQKKAPTERMEPVTKHQLSSEQLLIAILLYEPAKISPIKDKIEENDFKDPSLKKIYRLLLKEYNYGGITRGGITRGSITKDGKITKSLFEVDRELKNTTSTLVLGAENLYRDEPEKIDEDLTELIQHISSAKKEALKTFYADEIKKAEKTHDIAKLKKLIEEFQNAIS